MQRSLGGSRAPALALALLCASPAQAAPCRQTDELARLACQLQDDNPIARRSACYALVDLGGRALPVLTRHLQHARAEVRLDAARTLGQLREAAAPAAPALARLLQDKDAQVRREVALALGGLGASAAQAVPALLKSVDDPDAEVQSYATLALGELGPAAAAAVPRLIRLLAGPHAERAATALGQIGPAAAPAVSALIKALAPGRPLSLRLRAARALGALGPKARRARPALERMAAEQDAWTARAARQALADLAPPRGKRAQDHSAPAALPAGTQVLLTGPTDEDFRRATAALTAECLRAGKPAGRRNPALAIGPIRNRSSEHINTDLLQVLLYRALQTRSDLRLVRADARPDLLLSGWLVSMNDHDGRGRVVQSLTYALSVAAPRGGRRVCLGLHAIRKLEQRGAQGLTTKTLAPDQDPGFSSTFNDLDARRVGAQLAKALLARRPPRVLELGVLRNRTTEHINWRLIMLHLERALLASGRVQTYLDADELEQLLEAGRGANAASAPRQRTITRATHTVEGEIRSQERPAAAPPGRVRSYQIRAEVRESRTGRVVRTAEARVDKPLR